MFNDLQSFKLQQYTCCDMAVTHVQLAKPAAKQDSIGEFGAFTTLWGRGPDSCGTLNKQKNWAPRRLGQETKTLGICPVIVQHQSYLYVPCSRPSDHAAAKRSLEVEL